MNNPIELRNGLLVDHIAQKDLITCAPNTTVDVVLSIMAEKHIGCMVITEDNKPVGVVTRTDLIQIAITEKQRQQLPVAGVMSSPVRTVKETDTVDDAGLRFITDKVRHLVVTDQRGNLCGIISETDVVNSQGVEHDLFLRSVSEIANHNPTTIDAEKTVTDALTLLRNCNSSALLITQHDEIAGILTERDAIRLLCQNQLERQVGQCCSTTLITIDQSLSLYNARKVFHQHQFHHLAITDHSGTITGLVSYSDILKSVETDYVYRLRELLDERDRALEVSQRNLILAEKVIETSMEAILICDHNARIVRVNPAFTEITGWQESEVLDQNPNILSSGRHDEFFYQKMWQSLQEKGFWQGEIWNKRKDGQVYPEWLSITAIKDSQGKITQYASIFSDLTEIKRSEARIKRLAYFDELTRLPNRKLFNDRLQLSLGYAREHGHRIAVATIDVDFFQQVNDLYGHDAGDTVLREIAQRIELQLEEGDTVARFGGDQFNLILTDVDDTPHISEFLNRLMTSVSQPITVAEKSLKTSVSIGVSFFPTDADDAETLLKCSNSAVHQAKEFGRNSFRFFSPEQHRLIQSRYQMGNDLQAAIGNGEFQLYYQPKTDINSGLPIGCEALLRWKHPQLGYVSPAEFIPLAEDMGLITRIGQFVIEDAIQQASQWFRQGYKIPIAINISAKQFLHGDIAERILETQAAHNIPSELISIELTESSFLHCLKQTQAGINTLRSAGIKVAIDDFGTGYSSLSYIRTIALDILKIDRSFLINIESSVTDRAIVSSIIEMSHVMGLQVVAEGIETQPQLEALRELKCDQIQGYLIARPMPAEAFIEWYKHSSSLEY